MFKPHIGDCKNPECGRTGVIIPIRSGICQYCNHEKKQRAKTVSNRTTRSNDESKQEGDYDERKRTKPNGCPAYKHGRTPGEIYQKAKSSFRKTRKPLFKPKKGTGEAEVFAEIAEEREWICFVTGRHLSGLTPTQFMHVLPKALNKYPLFKLYKPNIQLASDEVHYAWDFKPRSELRKDRRFDKLFELEAELKEEYKNLKSQT